MKANGRRRWRASRRWLRLPAVETRGVLWVSANLDARPHTGSAIRSHRLLTALASRAPVDVLALNGPDAAGIEVATGARSLSIRSVGGRSASLAARRRWPRQWAAFWEPTVARDIHMAATDGTLVLLEHGYLAPYRPPAGPYVLSFHNVDSDLGRDLPWPRRPRNLLGRVWDGAVWPGCEKRAAADPRAIVVTTSEVDAQRLGRTDAVVVPNGTDVPSSAPVTPERGSVLFVGSLDYQPNALAVQWWIDAIAPHVPAGLPPLTVVGRAPEALDARRRGGLDLIGRVDDVDPYLRAATVVVIPLRHGSGTRLKLLEAMAWGRAVVATSKAVEGVPVIDGNHVLIRDNPAAFAAATADLWSHPELARELGANGREFARQYEWAAIGERFAAAVLGAV